MCSLPAPAPAPSFEPPPTRDPRHAADLPQPLTSFVGRRAHLANIVGHLRQPDVRLMTLVGTAGVGKTRLALAAAAELEAHFPDGVHVVSFAALRDRDQVPSAIAEALGVQSVAGDSVESRVINVARGRRMLLVLDNLEHLLPLPFLTRLLTACRELTVLATSRVVLRLSGEHQYVVPPMEVPSLESPVSVADLAGIESVALLVSRARQSVPDFDLTPGNAAAIAALCVRLDGLPLAIELAAARLKVFPPAALLDRLSDRLALLTGGPSDSPEHQRTIRDTLGWSHDLLSSREQRLFRRLAVFAGSITPEAAAEVCRDDEAIVPSDVVVLDELVSLVDQSLLQQAPQPKDGPRFYLLETVRHYAQERLDRSGDATEVRARHARYFLHVAERVAPLLVGPEQTTWMSWLDDEQANMWTALEIFRAEDDRVRYARLACALWRFWRARGKLVEGRTWLEPVLSDVWEASLPAPLRSHAFTNAGWLALEQGDVRQATACGERALAIATVAADDSAHGRAFGLLSFVDHRLGEYARAIARMEASLAHHRAAGDADNVAGSLNNLAILLMETGDFARAAEICVESRDAFLALGNTHGASHSIDTMGVALYCLGRFEEAMRCSRESLAIDRRLEDKRGIAVSLDHVGKCARALGDLVAAWESHRESLALRLELGDPRGLLVWLEAMALWLVHAGCAEQAARILGATEVARTSTNLHLQSHEQGDHAETERLARQRLGPQAYEAQVAKGRWLTLDETVAIARETAERRAAELAQGSPAIPPGIADRFGLTPREVEVLQLLARRYADKEIAEALFISPRTVARHVTGILAKMGVRSRREAAALVEKIG